MRQENLVQTKSFGHCCVGGLTYLYALSKKRERILSEDFIYGHRNICRSSNDRL
jgi:hypothetical protein